MPGGMITTASTLQCPHGGSVTIATTNTMVTAGSPLALATDSFTIAGCPFQVPVGVGTVPHPCVRVQWTAVNPLTSVNGNPTLTEDSVGVCLAADQAPQGKVVIAATQSLVSSS